MRQTVKTPAEIIQLSRSGEVVTHGWGRSKRKLHTVGHCRQEASRVYHLAAKGQIPPEDLSRAIYALDRIARLCEIEELERRVAALELALAARAKP